jgi:pimeloyl-ACP methyl ester carboxylesterase
MKTAGPFRIALASVLLLTLAAPAGWNIAAATWSHRKHPPPGSLHAVDGHQMHLQCTGSGSPTVVLEAAASATWLAWRRVQPQLAQLTRVCSYDRAGHGWSDPRPGPRDADHIVGELHALLDNAGIQRPLVLVGHSAGGLYVREYARRFPTEVAGVALLDASSPQQLDTLPGWRADYENERRGYPATLRREKLRVWSGWERLMGRCSVDPSGERPEITGQYAALMCRPAFVGGEESEYAYFEETSRQAARLTNFGAAPLVIISRDPAAEADVSAQSAAQERAWDLEQERMKALSPLSWRVIAAGSGHGVHHGRLELVVAELTLLIEHLRGGPAPPFGTTARK